MTVLLHDVDEAIAPIFARQELPSFLLVRDLLYADDTLLMNSSHEVLQEHLNVVIRVGKQFGLELNYEETLLLAIRPEGEIYSPGGDRIKQVRQAIYFGAF